jgi:hypothetical protein
MEKSASQWLGAAALGLGALVGYRYLNRGPRNVTVTPALSGDTATAEDDEPLPPLTQGDAEEETPAVPSTPTNNPAWSRAATDRLVSMGWNAQTVGTILGKYLQRLALSSTDADVVRTAIGQVGTPPESGPWPITIATPAPTVVTPPAPKPVVPAPKPVVPAKPKVWRYTLVRRSETGRLDTIAKKYAHAPKGAREIQETFAIIANKNGFRGWKGSTVMRRRTIYVPAWKQV